MEKLSLTSRVLAIVFWIGVTVLGVYLVYPKTGKSTTPRDADILVKIHNICEGILLVALGAYSTFETLRTFKAREGLTAWQQFKHDSLRLFLYAIISGYVIGGHRYSETFESIAMWLGILGFVIALLYLVQTLAFFTGQNLHHLRNSHNTNGRHHSNEDEYHQAGPASSSMQRPLVSDEAAAALEDGSAPRQGNNAIRAEDPSYAERRSGSPGLNEPAPYTPPQPRKADSPVFGSGKKQPWEQGAADGPKGNPFAGGASEASSSTVGLIKLERLLSSRSTSSAVSPRDILHCFKGLTTAQKRSVPSSTMDSAFSLLRAQRLGPLDVSGAMVSFGVYSDHFLEDLLRWQIEQGPTVYRQFPPLLSQSLWTSKEKLHRKAVEEYVNFAARAVASDGDTLLANLQLGEVYNLLEVFGHNETWQPAFEQVCIFVARDTLASRLSLRDVAMLMAAFVRCKGSLEVPHLSHFMPGLLQRVVDLLGNKKATGRIRPDWAALITNSIAKALMDPSGEDVKSVMSQLMAEALKDGKEPDNIAKIYLAAAKLEILSSHSATDWLLPKVADSSLTMSMMSAGLARSPQLLLASVKLLARRKGLESLSEACKYQAITGLLGTWPLLRGAELRDLRAINHVIEAMEMNKLKAAASSFALIASTRDHIGCMDALKAITGSDKALSPLHHMVTEAFALPYWIDVVLVPIHRGLDHPPPPLAFNSIRSSCHDRPSPHSSSDGSEYADVDWASPSDNETASITAATTIQTGQEVHITLPPQRGRKRRRNARPVSRREIMAWFSAFEDLTHLCFDSDLIKRAVNDRMREMDVPLPSQAPFTMVPWPPYWIAADPSQLDLSLEPLPTSESIADELLLSDGGVSTYIGALAATCAAIEGGATLFAATGYPMPWLEIGSGKAVGLPPGKSRTLGVVIGKRKIGDFFDATVKYGSLRRAKILKWLRISPGPDDGKLPRSIEGFRNSTTYILDSQLTKFDHLKEAARPVGVFSGRDPIYLREDVERLRTESQWERRGMVLRSDAGSCKRTLETKRKLVKLYSEEQTEEAPERHLGADGEIPVNRFGFVDLTDGRRPPEGTEFVVGIPLRRVIRKCKEIGVEHWAPAHTGWMAQRPQIGGVVVAMADASVLRDSLEEDTRTREEAQRLKDERLAKIAWKALIKRLLARRYVEMISASSATSRRH
ncbi:hypothetical protein FOL47_000016 [Perkinsus chesapeaki]|uniref:Rad4 beta-hairpin domain-containing protein n=1 Tax=Perkinsus chesapeaki TaxID=330153 RepID=A0A7J6N2Z3_PERCH|nr:hypothetical protein FOL47_000016 [Perkinsus chesapeaki]